jgi:hypothetical protein
MDPDDPAAQAPDKAQKGPSRLKRQKNPSTVNTSSVQHSSRLAELPTEILILICHAVREQVGGGSSIPDHPRDLVHLGRTCRALHLAAQDVLYREVSIGGHTDYSRESVVYRINLSNLVCLSCLLDPDFSFLLQGLMTANILTH